MILRRAVIHQGNVFAESKSFFKRKVFGFITYQSWAFANYSSMGFGNWDCSFCWSFEDISNTWQA